jgi:membrane-associated protease RseP (regulator of RpoE activity)
MHEPRIPLEGFAQMEVVAPATPSEPILAEAAEPDQPRRMALPLGLFLATCYSTYSAGGLAYAGPLMIILLCHEFGHFVQAVRYRVPASLPYFIPMYPPLGTMGAVIGMRGNMGNRKALFDIGISGPLAGLVPTIVFSVIGLNLSHFGPLPELIPGSGQPSLGEPLLFKFLAHWILGPTPANQDLYLHPMAYAGWVGVFITALNLVPIGQLDGGHVLYALLRRKAYPITSFLLLAAMVGVLVTQNYGWLLMLFLLSMMGPNHPPTGDDDIPLGTFRTVLGWVTLLFVLIGFTPTPFVTH